MIRTEQTIFEVCRDLAMILQSIQRLGEPVDIRFQRDGLSLYSFTCLSLPDSPPGSSELAAAFEQAFRCVSSDRPRLAIGNLWVKDVEGRYYLGAIGTPDAEWLEISEALYRAFLAEWPKSPPDSQ